MQHQDDALAPPPPPPSPPPPPAFPGGAQAPAAASDGAVPGPPAKRQRTENGQLAAALTKIRSHIGNPKKFAKAAPLLRQLFAEGKLSGAHGDLAFECLKAAMRDPQQARQPELRKEYAKLFTAASKSSQIFSARERAQLDVYGLLAVLRGQLDTDDSFELNRVLARIKQSVAELPVATPEDDAALASLGASSDAQPAGDAAAAAEAVPQREPAWTPQQALCMRREALLACLEAAQEVHGKLWARTSVEIAFEDAHKHLDKFCTAQQPRLDVLLRFTKQQRLARQQGKSAAREDRRDRTAFETARCEWGKTTGISGRGAVGGGGDHRSEVWLG